MVHVGSKTTSRGQILEKPCVHYRGHIFSPIIMKPGQNVCLDEISDKFENGSCWLKNKVTRSNLRITVRKAYVSDYRAIMALLFYYGLNRTRLVSAIFLWIRKFAIFDLLYMLASTNINQSGPNLIKIDMILRSWTSSITGVIGHKQHELFALKLELVYLAWFTP